MAASVCRQRACGSPGARPAVEKEIRRFLGKDLVVVMSWDTQGTDVDLHVAEPGGEECHYQKTRTASGGSFDHDDTDGLGPETYSLRRTAAGSYRVEAVYFSGGPRTVVTVKVYRNAGSPDETVTTHTAELTEKGQRALVVEIAR